MTPGFTDKKIMSRCIKLFLRTYVDYAGRIIIAYVLVTLVRITPDFTAIPI